MFPYGVPFRVDVHRDGAIHVCGAFAADLVDCRPVWCSGGLTPFRLLTIRYDNAMGHVLFGLPLPGCQAWVGVWKGCQFRWRGQIETCDVLGRRGELLCAAVLVTQPAPAGILALPHSADALGASLVGEPRLLSPFASIGFCRGPRAAGGRFVHWLALVSPCPRGQQKAPLNGEAGSPGMGGSSIVGSGLFGPTGTSGWSCPARAKVANDEVSYGGSCRHRLVST